jgi:hypothetical protein
LQGAERPKREQIVGCRLTRRAMSTFHAPVERGVEVKRGAQEGGENGGLRGEERGAELG